MSVEEIQSIKDSLHRIEQALMGDPTMGHRGIVSRLETVEQQQNEQGKKLILWGGIAAGVSIALTHLKTKVFG